MRQFRRGNVCHEPAGLLDLRTLRLHIGDIRTVKNIMRNAFAALWFLIALAPVAQGAGRIVEVKYAGSDKPGELVFGVTYRLWIPDGVKFLRGIIVHQHGCGKGASEGGETAADDLHWQALAAKWDCALLGPSYQQEDKQNCRLWCDPRNGSRARFLQGLTDLAKASGHPEIETVPWCLWGHSGGGFWASLMMTSDPSRVMAAWLRSGTAFSAWEKGEIARPEIPDGAYRIPIVCNPGLKERDDQRFSSAWTGAMAMFTAFRAKGAPICFAPDPRTGHECGESRDLAIPFFDACLAERLPSAGSGKQPLAELKSQTAWLGDISTFKTSPAEQATGKPEPVAYLVNKAVALAWMEYCKTGTVGDATPPPAPTDLEVKPNGKGGAELTWDAKADLESGISAFVIERDGKEIGRVPEKPMPRFGRPLFQRMSYHDTPEKPLATMRFVDPAPQPDKRHIYRIYTINGGGVRSAPSLPLRSF